MKSRLQIMRTFRQIVVNLPKIYHVYRHNRNRTTLIPQISKHIITILIRFFASTSTSRQNGVYFLFRRSNSQVYYYSVVRATIYTLFNNSNCSRASRKLANFRVRSRQFTLKRILHTWPAVQKMIFRTYRATQTYAHRFYKPTNHATAWCTDASHTQTCTAPPQNYFNKTV